MTNNIESLVLKRVKEAIKKGDNTQAERILELLYTDGYCNGWHSAKNVGYLRENKEIEKL